MGLGSASIVWVAVCKRGRLRDRKVALKMVQDLILYRLSLPPSNSTSGVKQKESASHVGKEWPSISSAIHMSLHHPSIISLFSTFLVEGALCQVMELCPSGNLLELLLARKHHPLPEYELRGVLRSLVDALIYLRNELVIHGNINPENVLVTEDGRAVSLST